MKYKKYRLDFPSDQRLIIIKQHREAAAVLMRLVRLLLVFFMVPGWSISITARASSFACTEEVNEFLVRADEQALKAVSGAVDQKCWSAIQSSNANLNKLIHSVERGNRWSAQYLAEHLKDLDGGNLEDSLVALGQFSTHGMEQLLRFKRDGQLSEIELKDALTMLPLSLSDNPRGQLDALKARRQRVMQITQGGLAGERAEALKAIDDFASEIKSKTPQ